MVHPGRTGNTFSSLSAVWHIGNKPPAKSTNASALLCRGRTAASIPGDPAAPARSQGGSAGTFPPLPPSTPGQHLLLFTGVGTLPLPSLPQTQQHWVCTAGLQDLDWSSWNSALCTSSPGLQCLRYSASFKFWNILLLTNCVAIFFNFKNSWLKDILIQICHLIL